MSEIPFNEITSMLSAFSPSDLLSKTAALQLIPQNAVHLFRLSVCAKAAFLLGTSLNTLEDKPNPTTDEIDHLLNTATLILKFAI